MTDSAWIATDTTKPSLELNIYGISSVLTFAVPLPPTPEPASVLFMIFGLGGAAVFVQRRGEPRRTED